jgi:hypothetical protein
VALLGFFYWTVYAKRVHSSITPSAACTELPGRGDADKLYADIVLPALGIPFPSSSSPSSTVQTTLPACSSTRLLLFTVIATFFQYSVQYHLRCFGGIYGYFLFADNDRAVYLQRFCEIVYTDGRRSTLLFLTIPLLVRTLEVWKSVCVTDQEMNWRFGYYNETTKKHLWKEYLLTGSVATSLQTVTAGKVLRTRALLLSIFVQCSMNGAI